MALDCVLTDVGGRAASERHARALANRIKAHPAYAMALGSQLATERAQDTTDPTTSKPTPTGIDQTDGVVELDFDKNISEGVNFYAKCDGDAEFVFLAHYAAPAPPNSDVGGSPYLEQPPLLVATKLELREFKALYLQSNAETGLFSDKVVVNWAP